MFGNMPFPGLAQFAFVVGVIFTLHSRHKKRESKAQNFHTKKQKVIHNKPYPPSFSRLLESCQLCAFSTYLSEPHLSLMHYTYYAEENVIIFCTKILTKKYLQFIASPDVAMLIHDFPQVRLQDKENSSANEIYSPLENFAQTMSLTINGTIEVCMPGSKEESFYRDIHLKRHPSAGQFIVNGRDHRIAVLTPIKARFCDSNHRVAYWNVIEGVTLHDSTYYNLKMEDIISVA